MNLTLRSLFLVAVAAVVIVSASRVPWVGVLSDGSQAWILDLGRGPLWYAPVAPAESDFRSVFGDEAIGSGTLEIRREVAWAFVLTALVMQLWAVFGVIGVFALASREARRDWALRLITGGGFGMTAGAAACVGLWFAWGGFGPPVPYLFGAVGLVLGLVVSSVWIWAVRGTPRPRKVGLTDAAGPVD